MSINERRDWGSGFRMKKLTVVMTATILAAGGAVEAELAAGCDVQAELAAGDAVQADSDSLIKLRERIKDTKGCIELELKRDLNTLETDVRENKNAVAKAKTRLESVKDQVLAAQELLRQVNANPASKGILLKEDNTKLVDADATSVNEAQRDLEAAMTKLKETELKRDAKQGNLIVAEQILENDENERDFRDLSFNAGVAVLRESGPDGGNETETMISMHQLLRTWNDGSVGLGPFVAINAEGDVAKLIGLGALFSFRRENGAHPLSVGAGYMVDRFGFKNDDGTRLGDRSGLFFVVSFNPAMSGVNIFENLFKIPD